MCDHLLSRAKKLGCLPDSQLLLLLSFLWKRDEQLEHWTRMLLLCWREGTGVWKEWRTPQPVWGCSSYSVSPKASVRCSLEQGWVWVAINTPWLTSEELVIRRQKGGRGQFWWWGGDEGTGYLLPCHQKWLFLFWSCHRLRTIIPCPVRTEPRLWKLMLFCASLENWYFFFPSGYILLVYEFSCVIAFKCAASVATFVFLWFLGQ